MEQGEVILVLLVARASRLAACGREVATCSSKVFRRGTTWRATPASPNNDSPRRTRERTRSLPLPFLGHFRKKQ